MRSAPLRENESSILAALHALDVLSRETPPELDAIVQVASIACEAPISLISLVDSDRQVFKANHGLTGVVETPRDIAICAHAVLADDLFEIPDSRLDVRFADNPLVTGAPHIRFYAGAPLALADGARIGTLCVIDRRPRQLRPSQREILRHLSVVASKSLESRRALRLMSESAVQPANALAVMHHSADAVIGISANGRIVRWNPAAQRMFGYTQAEIIGMPLHTLAPPEAHERQRAMVAAIADGTSRSYHAQALDRAGARMSVHATLVPELDGRGRLSGATKFIRDVTAQHQANSLMDSERLQLKTLLETIPDLVWLKDSAGVYLTCNRAFEALFGARAADIVGKTDFDFMAPELARGLQAKDSAVVEAGRPIVNEEWASFAADGRRVLLETTKAPMHDSRGALVGILGIARDITQHRRYRDHLEELVAERTAALLAANAAAEEAHRLSRERLVEESEQKIRSSKLEAVGTLAAGVAHDFNNILASIVGFAEMTSEDCPDDSIAKQNMAQILSGSFRARDLIARLLTFARENNPLPTPSDVSHAIRDALALLRGSLPATVEVALDDALPKEGVQVLAAPGQLMQIVMNLCINSAHAMQERGTIRIQLSPLSSGVSGVESTARPVDTVSLKVSDCGHGMPTDVQARMFDPFFTTKMPGEGSGLGLSVVYGIVSSIGGSIAVQSSTNPADSGTVVDVRIPIVKASSPGEIKWPTSL